MGQCLGLDQEVRPKAVGLKRKKLKMTDLIGKELFDKYSKDCRYMVVADSGQVVKSKPVKVCSVCFKNDGTIKIEWEDNDYELKRSYLNQIESAYSTYAEGVFNSSEIASETVQKSFLDSKKERIKCLEEEIAQLKSEIQ